MPERRVTMSRQGNWPKTLLACTLVGSLAVPNAAGQEIESRAYSPAPLGTQFVVAGFGHAQGPILLDPSLDIDDFNGDVWLLTAGVGRVFGVAGHQARVFALFPIAVGSVSGDVQRQTFSQTVSGLVDPRFKVTLGLLGAPATKTVAAQRPLVVGTSLTVSAPLGQYDRTQLVSLSRHRWAFKPEVGISHVVGHWTFEAQTGVWVFMTNDQYYPGHARQSQDPIVAIQTNVSYALTRRSWLAVGGTLFSGGQTRVDGVENPNLQRNSRIGAALSLPIAAKQSVQVIYGTGVTTRRGWDFSSLIVTWQFVTF
jgi:hypothetical protein